MAITFELDSPEDLLAKARREKARLQKAIFDQDRTQIADDMFNFAVTAFHIKDWLIAAGVRDVKTYVSSVQVLRICEEICSASKHCRLIPPAKDVGAVTASATTALSPMNLHPEGEGVRLDALQPPQFRMKVVALDGSRFEVMDFSAQVIRAWEQYFTNHGRGTFGSPLG